MTGPSYLDRVVADSADRPTWLAARGDRIGASDAAKFAKLESVDLYARAKFGSGKKFHGNRYTDSGNYWEPIMLKQLGIPRNTLFVHSIEEEDFGATPDGIEVLPSGEIVLAEAKAKHDRIVFGPTKAELRQMWWAQYVFGPEATHTKFVWHEIVNGAPRRLEPHILLVERDETEIQKMLRIARPVLDRVRELRAIEKELKAA